MYAPDSYMSLLRCPRCAGGWNGESCALSQPISSRRALLPSRPVPGHEKLIDNERKGRPQSGDDTMITDLAGKTREVQRILFITIV
jgi:hypothetical protein